MRAHLQYLGRTDRASLHLSLIFVDVIYELL